MQNLLLNSLHTKGFRAFNQLSIKELGRVNLIVGKNNVGKSSLLEALRLYASRGNPSVMWEILGSRDEDRRGYGGDKVPIHDSMRFLFHGWPEIDPTINQDKLPELTIGSIDESVPVLTMKAHIATNSHLGLQILVDTTPIYFIGSDPAPGFIEPGLPCEFIPASGFGKQQIVKMWDSVALTDAEDNVVDALRLITPDVKRINMIAGPTYGNGNDRIPVVRVEGVGLPVPLRSLGEGMNRLFGLALALVNAKNGLLLVDEIESGLHYSVLSKVWRLVFEVARQLNVQVFATTHSWDCIESFQQAAQEDEESKGMLIRLERKGEETKTTLFDERRLGIAAREEIEVR